LVVSAIPNTTYLAPVSLTLQRRANDAVDIPAMVAEYPEPLIATPPLPPATSDSATELVGLPEHHVIRCASRAEEDVSEAVAVDITCDASDPARIRDR
jgi:hypothetical protein